MINRIGDGLWVAEQAQRFFGMEVGTRMTVVRLSDGGLFVHSPIRLTDGLRRELEGLGEVRFLIAPNKLHHLYIGDYRAAYPEARMFAAPGLDRKRRDLRFDGLLSGGAEMPWAGQIDQLLFPGEPILNEVVFCDRRNCTLIVTDIVFNIQRSDSTFTRISLKLDGAWRKFGPSRLMRLLMLRYRRDARRAIDRIIEWDFDRVVLTHGDILERGGKEAMRRAFAFL